MKKEDNIIIRWLKRINISQVISIAVAAFAAIVTYLMYDNSKPGNLSFYHLEFGSQDSVNATFIKREATNVTKYWNLLITDVPYLQTNIHTENSIGEVWCLPIIENNSSKSLEHFKCKITIWFNKEIHKAIENSINGRESDLNILGKSHDYKVLEFTENTLELEYKNDFLPAASYVPEPLHELFLYDEHSDSADVEAKITFHYNITYDGLEKPLAFSVYSRIYQTNKYDNPEYISEKTKDFVENEIYSKSNQRNAKDDDVWSFTMNNHFLYNIRHTRPDNITEWNKYALLQLLKENQ